MTTKQTGTRNILIGLSGLTPQVISETLYCLLTQKKIGVDEIFVITTGKGKEIILGKGSLPALKNELERMGKEHNLKMPAFDPDRNVFIAKEDYELLDDVRTSKENELFPNFIVDFIRRHAIGNTCLYCSLSGGRKTMSVAMAYALSLYGRPCDGLYHVIADPEFEATKRFFPETAAEGKKLVLSEVPYVRLRDKLDQDPIYNQSAYMDMVIEAQRQIENLVKVPECRADIRRMSLEIGKKTIPLQPFHMAVYLFFMENKSAVKGGKSMDNASIEKIKAIYRKIAPGNSHTDRVMQTLGGSGAAPALSKAISIINRKIRDSIGSDLCSYYLINKDGSYANKFYSVPLDRKLFRKTK